jgi:phosphoribosylglycinamide formyltransferase-1
VIRVDEGVDTGPVLLRKSFHRDGSETLAEVEKRIHALEHQWFPRVILEMLDAVDGPTRPVATP